MRAMMEATNDLIGRSLGGSKRLREMHLTEDERVRIDRVMADPRYRRAEDAIIQQVPGKTKFSRWIGALRIRRYKTVFQKLSKD